MFYILIVILIPIKRGRAGLCLDRDEFPEVADIVGVGAREEAQGLVQAGHSVAVKATRQTLRVIFGWEALARFARRGVAGLACAVVTSASLEEREARDER